MSLSRGLRLALALALYSLWLAVLFAGFAGHGAVHLLLAGSLALFPWRQVLPPAGGETAQREP